MKKFVQISLAIVVAFSLVIGIIQLVPDVTTNVGWNGRYGTTQSESLQVAGCNSCILLPGSETAPNVGWNSGV
jgi:hypothetical protein